MTPIFHTFVGKSSLVARSAKGLLFLGVASAALTALVRLGPRYDTVFAAGTPATSAVTDRLIMQQGSGVLTQYGDFIAANPGAGGLNRPYSYYIEVPPGLASLQVDLFDADVGASGNDVANDRDRNIGGFNTCARYQLFRPNGTLMATTVRGLAGGCVLVPNSNAGDKNRKKMARVYVARAHAC